MPVPAVVVNPADEVMVTMLGITRAASSSGVRETIGDGGAVVITVTGADSVVPGYVPGVSGGAASASPPNPSMRNAAIQRLRGRLPRC